MHEPTPHRPQDGPAENPDVQSQDGPRNPIWQRLAAAVDQFGVNSSPTRSRRHGYQPFARQHVEAYLSRTVLGFSVMKIATARGLHRSVVYKSIERGRRLVHSRSKTAGFILPDGQRVTRATLNAARAERLAAEAEHEPEDPWALD